MSRGVPDDVDELLANYLVSGVSRGAPNIDVNFETIPCSSNGQARRVLAAASADGKPYWAAIRVPIQHPEWWPALNGAEAVGLASALETSSHQRRVSWQHCRLGQGCQPSHRNEC
eukprot:6457063-Prymnesium_polylepis.1